MLRSRALGASDNLSKEVWAKTITEASRGSLSGPMEPEDLEAPDYTEPIGKAKGIDDMSASLINALQHFC